MQSTSTSSHLHRDVERNETALPSRSRPGKQGKQINLWAPTKSSRGTKGRRWGQEEEATYSAAVVVGAETRGSMSLSGGLSRAPGRGVSQEGHTDHPGNCEEGRVYEVESQQVRLKRWGEGQVAKNLPGQAEEFCS